MAAVRLLALAALVVAVMSGWGGRTSAPCAKRPAALPDHHGMLRGDVDGDGYADRVSVKAAHRAPSGCQLFLVARTRRGDLIRRLPGRYDSDFRWPQVAVLARIDARPGAEIVVTLSEGASTAFAGLFTVRGGAFRRLAVPFYGNVIDYFGSLAQGGAVDCGRPGQIISDSYGVGRRAERYDVDRELLQLDGLRFRVVRSTKYARVKWGWWERFPEFRSPQPFPSCAIARNSQTG